MVREILRQTHEESPASYREDERTTPGQILDDLLGDTLVSIGPLGIQMGMHEIRLPVPGNLDGVAEQVAAATGDLDQLHVQGTKLFLLGAAQGRWHDCRDGKAEGPGAD